jgi:integrase
VKLDAKSVAALTLDGKTDMIHFDDALPGFGYRLRLGAGGRELRSWIVQYRRAGGSRRVLLGSADVLSAEAARKEAKRVLAEVALGRDPQGDKADRRGKDKLSLRSVIDEYLTIKETEVRSSTFSEVRRYLTGAHFRPLHAMPVDTITRKDVAAQLLVIQRQRGRATSGLARAALSAFYAWVVAQGICESNPTIGTTKPKEAAPRSRVLSDDELRRIWLACREDAYGRIIKLLIQTGARRGEVGGMCWSEIDPDREEWTIPAERSKNHRTHTLPIMPLMASIVADVPRMVTRDQMFGSRGPGFSHWAASKRLLDERSGVTDWTVHDIRRSTATKMADIGIAPHIVEQILNHQSGHRAGVAGTYNRSSYTKEVRAALATWHDHLRSIIEGGERKILPLLPIGVG